MNKKIGAVLFLCAAQIDAAMMPLSWQDAPLFAVTAGVVLQVAWRSRNEYSRYLPAPRPLLGDAIRSLWGFGNGQTRTIPADKQENRAKALADEQPVSDHNDVFHDPQEKIEKDEGPAAAATPLRTPTPRPGVDGELEVAPVSQEGAAGITVDAPINEENVPALVGLTG